MPRLLFCSLYALGPGFTMCSGIHDLWVQLWPVVNVVTFGVVPLHYRPLFVGVISVFWSIFSSWSVHRTDNTDETAEERRHAHLSLLTGADHHHHHHHHHHHMESAPHVRQLAPAQEVEAEPRSSNTVAKHLTSQQTSPGGLSISGLKTDRSTRFEMLGPGARHQPQLAHAASLDEAGQLTDTQRGAQHVASSTRSASSGDGWSSSPSHAAGSHATAAGAHRPAAREVHAGRYTYWDRSHRSDQAR